MTNIFEVVFERVDKCHVVQVLTRIISGAKCIISVECTENIVLMNEGHLNIKGFESILNFNGDVSILIRLEDMKAGNVTLPSVLLRLVKYNELFDVDFNFDVDELKNTNAALVMSQLHGYAKQISGNFNVWNFFGGMEPAADKNTRYFTNQIVGPLN